MENPTSCVVQSILRNKKRNHIQDLVLRKIQIIESLFMNFYFALNFNPVKKFKKVFPLISDMTVQQPGKCCFVAELRRSQMKGIGGKVALISSPSFTVAGVFEIDHSTKRYCWLILFAT